MPGSGLDPDTLRLGSIDGSRRETWLYYIVITLDAAQGLFQSFSRHTFNRAYYRTWQYAPSFSLLKPTPPKDNNNSPFGNPPPAHGIGRSTSAASRSCHCLHPRPGSQYRSPPPSHFPQLRSVTPALQHPLCCYTLSHPLHFPPTMADEPEDESRSLARRYMDLFRDRLRMTCPGVE